MRSSQALTLPPLLSCHWRYPACSFATLSEGDPIGVTSRVSRDDVGSEVPRAGAIVPHASRVGHCVGSGLWAFESAYSVNHTPSSCWFRKCDGVMVHPR